MLASSRTPVVAAIACLSLFVLPGAPTARAAAPATVAVRVEGVSETKLPPTTVTTTTEPVVNDGKPEDACSGTSALGALQLATGGNWMGTWEAKFHQYFIESIEGEGEAVGSSKYYWSFWVNDRFQEEGACAVQLESGERVLFFPICYEGCPAGEQPTPLEIEAPASASVGEPVAVTVKRYSEKGEPAPAAGAEISWSGGTATTGSQGGATVSFATAGTYTLRVNGPKSGPPSVRTETTVCVRAGGEAGCGYPAACACTATTQAKTGGTTASAPYTGPFAIVARLTGIGEGHSFARGDAPRLLSGTVTAHTAVASVSLELRREFKGRCWYFNGVVERFVRARCGRGSPFHVSSSASFSYLLPAALPAGRYVLDIEASDVAGNRTTLARGTSRTVFFVR